MPTRRGEIVGSGGPAESRHSAIARIGPEPQPRDGAAPFFEPLFGAALRAGVAGALALIVTPAIVLSRSGLSGAGAGAGQEPERVLATVLFTDLVGSTELASQLGDRRWRQVLETHDQTVRRRVSAHGGRVLKSLGDGYLATFGAPARAIRCGRALVEDAMALGLQVKVGVHTGECERIGRDFAGMAVHIAARVVAKARPGEVLVTSAVRDLIVGSGIRFTHRGAHELKGVPGEWSLLAVEYRGPFTLRPRVVPIRREPPAPASAVARFIARVTSLA